MARENPDIVIHRTPPDAPGVYRYDNANAQHRINDSGINVGTPDYRLALVHNRRTYVDIMAYDRGVEYAIGCHCQTPNSCTTYGPGSIGSVYPDLGYGMRATLSACIAYLGRNRLYSFPDEAESHALIRMCQEEIDRYNQLMFDFMEA